MSACVCVCVCLKCEVRRIVQFRTPLCKEWIESIDRSIQSQPPLRFVLAAALPNNTTTAVPTHRSSARMRPSSAPKPAPPTSSSSSSSPIRANAVSSRSTRQRSTRQSWPVPRAVCVAAATAAPCEEQAARWRWSWTTPIDPSAILRGCQINAKVINEVAVCFWGGLIGWRGPQKRRPPRLAHPWRTTHMVGKGSEDMGQKRL